MQAHQAIVQRSHTFVNALLMIHVFDKFFFFGRKTSDAACSGYSCGPWHLFLIRLIKMKECVVCYKSRVATPKSVYKSLTVMLLPTSSQLSATVLSTSVNR